MKEKIAMSILNSPMNFGSTSNVRHIINNRTKPKPIKLTLEQLINQSAADIEVSPTKIKLEVPKKM